jgi:diguanylate cyclase (GGDEF)-like protein
MSRSAESPSGAGPAAVEGRAVRFRLWLGMAAVAAVACGAVAGALVVHSNETDAFRRRQQDEALRAARQVESVAGLSVGQLASAAAFYQAVERLTRHKFEVMAGSLLDGGALSGTGLILAVPGPRRSQFERGHGFPIVDRNPIGFRRAPARAHYFPLAFAASNSGLEPPLGYDVGADVVRRRYLQRARDTGTAAATKVMHLPIGGTGINVFRPVYRDGAPIATLAQRRAALVGFAVGAFHVDDLTATATSALPDGTRVQLVESGRSVTGPKLSRDDSGTAAVRIADRRWLLVVHDPGGPDVALPWLMAIFGILLAVLLGALVTIWSRNERLGELRRQASHDSLTGLKNRRRFDEELQAELARSRRYGVAGAVLMLDLDHFKQVNDSLGHAAGDRVIAEVAEVLRDRARETDVLARLGGDEFAVILPRCDLEAAQAVADALRDAIREHLAAEDGSPRITVSIGIAPFGTDSPHGSDSILARADSAMYAAKGAGRDSIRIFKGDDETTTVAGAQPDDVASP